MILLGVSPMTKEPIDKPELVTDKSGFWKEDIGAKKTQLPINRNLSLKLFGQLGNLTDKRI